MMETSENKTIFSEKDLHLTKIIEAEKSEKGLEHRFLSV